MDRASRNKIYDKIHAEAKKHGADVVRSSLRKLCQTDLFYLLTRVLGRKDADKDWLYDRCVEVQSNPDGMLDLWAREHYKSTIITYALTIQDILNNPEITIGIFSHTKPIAKAFLRQIKVEFESNKRLQFIFPDILWQYPKKEAPTWSEDKGIIVKRRTNPKEATIEAHGLVDGQPTSKHYDLLVYDDVVTLESVSTPEMIKKVTDAWALSLNLGANGGKIRYIGTRYHFNDTYKTIIERQSARPRKHPATEDGKPGGKPVFLTAGKLAQKRRDMGPYIFACQMLLDPRADESQGFDESWLRFYNEPPEPGTLNYYILVDPANEKKKTSDYTAMFVVGAGPDGNYYVVDIVRDRLNLTERSSMLFSLHRKYRPLSVAYEQYGIQADIQHIRYLQDKAGYHFEITPVGGRMPKNDRIRRLIPIFEQGRMWMPKTLFRFNSEGKNEDLISIFVEDEYKPFPVMLHDDMLDCLARVLDIKVMFRRKKKRSRRRQKKAVGWA